MKNLVHVHNKQLRIMNSKKVIRIMRNDTFKCVPQDNYNGWMDDLQFFVLFQQYLSHIRAMGHWVIMKGCVQWGLVYG